MAKKKIVDLEKGPEVETKEQIDPNGLLETLGDAKGCLNIELDGHHNQIAIDHAIKEVEKLINKAISIAKFISEALVEKKK